MAREGADSARRRSTRSNGVVPSPGHRSRCPRTARSTILITGSAHARPAHRKDFPWRVDS
jgi:hypothetical protein